MRTRLELEEEHASLKNKLGKSLQRKRALELRINEQFEKLKKLEMSLEKTEPASCTPSPQSIDFGHGKNEQKLNWAPLTSMIRT